MSATKILRTIAADPRHLTLDDFAGFIPADAVVYSLPTGKLFKWVSRTKSGWGWLPHGERADYARVSVDEEGVDPSSICCTRAMGPLSPLRR